MIRANVKNILLYLKLKKQKVIAHTNDISLKATIGRYSTIMTNTEVDSFSSIGKYCYVGKNCFITKANIGNYCSIANNVSIGQGEHCTSRISTSSLFYEDAYEELTSKDCTIGNDVWIGVDAIILRGVIIGDGAIVGANSVVTKNIPPFAIVVGSPAKIIRYRFDNLKIDRILSSKWWKLDISLAKKEIEKLREVN